MGAHRNEVDSLRESVSEIQGKIRDIQENCDHNLEFDGSIELTPTKQQGVFFIRSPHVAKAICIKCSYVKKGPAFGFEASVLDTCLKCLGEVRWKRQGELSDYFTNPDEFKPSWPELYGCNDCGFQFVRLVKNTPTGLG